MQHEPYRGQRHGQSACSQGRGGGPSAQREWGRPLYTHPCSRERSPKHSRGGRAAGTVGPKDPGTLSSCASKRVE